jgi:hypothetical protein
LHLTWGLDQISFHYLAKPGASTANSLNDVTLGRMTYGPLMKEDRVLIRRTIQIGDLVEAEEYRQKLATQLSTTVALFYDEYEQLLKSGRFQPDD